MSDASPRLSLPFLLPGQAQKEIFHNEALLTLDAIVHATVEDWPAASPPSTPAEGESWIVGAGAGGAWAGRDDAIATWSAGGWRFTAPLPGLTAWNRAAGLWLHWDGTAWSDGRWPAAALTIGGVQVVVRPRQLHLVRIRVVHQRTPSDPPIVLLWSGQRTPDRSVPRQRRA